MAYIPVNPDIRNTIKTDASGVPMQLCELAHINIPDAAAADTDGVCTAAPLSAAVQEITTNISNPAVPRNITITGNVSGITGTITVTGKNYNLEEITEDLTANGMSTVASAKAFKSVSQIDLPIRTHTPAYQTETIEVTHGCSTGGDITVAVTAGTLLGDDSPSSVTVTLTTAEDTVTEVAAAVVAALNDDETISAVFTASNSSGVITLTANDYAANDSTLSIAFTVGSTGVTVGSTTNGTTGVPVDTISVGWGDKFGLPYLLTADELVILKLFNNAVDTGTVANSATAIESNIFGPTGIPDGTKDIDLYIIV
jgi:hypothetical protein